jgi:hypothetical protein
MTSAFADFRGTHFHSGIDVRTWGRTGFPVIAEADGYISRIGVSTRGFGLALYVNHKDGTMRVYAHLEKFNPEIQKYARANQYSERSYSVQLYPISSELPFSKGDTLCYTGESGVGFPHLHYEYRNVNQQTINPFVKGLRGVKDTKAPTIFSISLRPMDTASRVDGVYSACVYPLIRVKGDTFSTIAMPKIWGKIGVGIHETDGADAAPNRFNARTLRLFVKDELCFETIRDSFYFDETRQVDLDYDLALNVDGKGAHASLYADEGNRLSFYGGRKKRDGILEFGAVPLRFPIGEYNIRVEAVDYWGNTAVGQMVVKVDSFPQGKSGLESSIFKTEVNNFQFSTERGVLLFKAPNSNYPPVVALSFRGIRDTVILHGKSANGWQGHILPSYNGVGILNIRAVGNNDTEHVLWNAPVLFVKTGESATLKSNDEQAVLNINVGDMPHSQAMWFDLIAVPKKSKEICFISSKGYTLMPTSVYTDKNINVSLVSERRKRAALYTLDSKGKWSFLSSSYDTILRAYTGKIRRPSTIAIGIDSTPPLIKVMAGKGQVLKISDQGSGIGSDRSIVAYINGRWALTEYDFESDIVKVELPDSLTKGKHILKIHAEDRAGNVSNKTVTFSK